MFCITQTSLFVALCMKWAVESICVYLLYICSFYKDICLSIPETCILILEQLMCNLSFYSLACVSSSTFKCVFVGTSCHEWFLDLVWFSSHTVQPAAISTHRRCKHFVFIRQLRRERGRMGRKKTGRKDKCKPSCSYYAKPVEGSEYILIYSKYSLTCKAISLEDTNVMILMPSY